MSPTQVFLLRLAATAIQVKASGEAGVLRDRLVAFGDEARDSLLEPQDNGEPWTDEAILAEKAKHDALLADISDRHTH